MHSYTTNIDNPVGAATAHVKASDLSQISPTLALTVSMRKDLPVPPTPLMNRTYEAVSVLSTYSYLSHAVSGDKGVVSPA